MNKGAIKKTILKYGVSAVAATALLFVVLSLNAYWTQTETSEKLRILCDAFSIPGALLILFSGLIFASNQGAFTGLLYGLRTAKDILLPFLQQEYVRYRDYQKKRESKKIKGYSFLFFTGAAFLTVGLVFLVLYHVVTP